jgi:hypothetical protein
VKRAGVWVRLAMCVIALSSLGVGAASVSDAELAKQQLPLIPGVKKAATDASGNSASLIDVKSTAHRIVVTVTDGKLLSAPSAERELQASKIAAAIATAIAGKPQFEQVLVIRIDYAKQQGGTAVIVDGIDFTKDAQGVFRLHVT